MAKIKAQKLIIPKAENDGSKKKRLLIGLSIAVLPAIYYSLNTMKPPGVKDGKEKVSLTSKGSPQLLSDPMAPRPRPAALPGKEPAIKKEPDLPRIVYTGPQNLPNLPEGGKVVEPLDLTNLPEGSRMEIKSAGVPEEGETPPPDTKIVTLLQSEDNDRDPKVDPNAPPPPPGIGSTLEAVVTAYGSPEAQIEDENATIMYYEQGEFEIQQGLVTRMKWKGKRTGDDGKKMILSPVRKMAGTIEFKPADPKAVNERHRLEKMEADKRKAELTKGLKVISPGQEGDFRIQKAD